MDAVRAHFRPEFLNRLDEIIVFDRLKRDRHGRDRRHPAARLVRLLADRKIALELDDGARKWLADEGLRPGLWRPAAEAGDPSDIKDGETCRTRWPR
jgi:ATP-dependent Clp protease ATP-binding subunit ClpB